jgi:hypothetical protein
VVVDMVVDLEKLPRFFDAVSQTNFIMIGRRAHESAPTAPPKIIPSTG